MLTGFEQFAVGQTFASAPRGLDAAAIKAFAVQFDFQPQHIDEAAAERTMFGGLAASGWHTASLTMRLMLESVLEGGERRGLGVQINDIALARRRAPGRCAGGGKRGAGGAALPLQADRGLVVIRTTTRNQGGQVVQTMTGTPMILRSDATP